jgi:hypothetical protein
MIKEEAIALASTRWWEKCDAKKVALFQLQEPLLCMDFSAFHKAVEESLGRSVWTHEFANPSRLLEELLGENDPPSMEDIINMIPANKRVVLMEAPR